MLVASFIVIALAFGVVNMLLFSRCGKTTPVRLSVGLLIVLLVAVVHTVFYWLGITVGNLLHLQSPTDGTMYSDINAYIFLGMVVVVVIKMLVPYLRREPRLPLFDLRQRSSVLAMAVATGINVLLVGLGVGFVSHESSIHLIIWPLLVFCLLLGYMGLMFGRQHVQLRPRRWMVLACILLLATAIAACVNA